MRGLSCGADAGPTEECELAVPSEACDVPVRLVLARHLLHWLLAVAAKLPDNHAIASVVLQYLEVGVGSVEE